MLQTSIGVSQSLLDCKEDIMPYADLQQAMQKAMDRIGMTAQARAADSQLMAQTDREQELLDRIEYLESQLQLQSKH